MASMSYGAWLVCKLLTLHSAECKLNALVPFCTASSCDAKRTAGCTGSTAGARQPAQVIIVLAQLQVSAQPQSELTYEAHLEHISIESASKSMVASGLHAAQEQPAYLESHMVKQQITRAGRKACGDMWGLTMTMEAIQKPSSAYAQYPKLNSV